MPFIICDIELETDGKLIKLKPIGIKCKTQRSKRTPEERCDTVEVDETHMKLSFFPRRYNNKKYCFLSGRQS